MTKPGKEGENRRRILGGEMINQDILTPTYFYLLNILMIFRHSCLRIQRILLVSCIVKKKPLSICKHGFCCKSLLSTKSL